MELGQLYSVPDIVAGVHYRRLRWVGHFFEEGKQWIAEEGFEEQPAKLKTFWISKSVVMGPS